MGQKVIIEIEDLRELAFGRENYGCIGKVEDYEFCAEEPMPCPHVLLCKIIAAQLERED